MMFLQCGTGAVLTTNRKLQDPLYILPVLDQLEEEQEQKRKQKENLMNENQLQTRFFEVVAEYYQPYSLW
jgi:hypothetical protein